MRTYLVHETVKQSLISTDLLVVKASGMELPSPVLTRWLFFGRPMSSKTLASEARPLAVAFGTQALS